MKISCEIIKDLLPLYHDGICSNDSKEMVNEHLSLCPSCMADLEAMDVEFHIDHSQHNLEDAQVVKNLSKKWKKGMSKSMIKGILYTILIIALFLLILISFVDFTIIPSPN